MAVDTVNRHSNDAGYNRTCIMCCRPPSELAALAYSLCLSSGLKHSVAAEACVAYDQAAVTMSSGATVEVSTLRYDIVSLVPAGLVIEVMGEQHTNKEMAHLNSNESRGANSAELDRIKQQAAARAGYSTVWLMAGDQHGRTARWRKALSKALLHVTAGGPPAHFSSPRR